MQRLQARQIDVCGQLHAVAHWRHLVMENHWRGLHQGRRGSRGAEENERQYWRELRLSLHFPVLFVT